MRRKILALSTVLALVASSAVTLANVGVFEGEGHTIELTGTAKVRLVEEEVTIVPGRGMWPFDGSLSPRTLDHADYDCRFVLENLEDSPVEIRVGFPLNAERFSFPHPDSGASADPVVFYRFQVRDGGATCPVEYRPADREKRLSSVFLWTSRFGPEEHKTVRVTYRMPISAGLSPTAKDPDRDSDEALPWTGSLEAALGEGVGYVVRTGGSWAGKIDRATFRIVLGPFEGWLRRRGGSEESGGERRPLPFEPLLHRELHPDGWTEEDGALVLTREDWEPAAEDDIAVAWRLCALPRTEAAMRVLLEQAAPVEGWTVADLKALRAILLATDGVVPADAAAKAFVERQIWYGPAEGKTEAQASEGVRKAVALVDAARGKVGKVPTEVDGPEK